jgi:hypothetical protein
VALLCLPTSAFAEQPDASAQAIQLGHDGLALYQQGRWQEALASFDQAARTMYSPVFELYMARCERNLDLMREAARRLEALLARPSTEDAPVAWGNALRDARAELEALRRSIPTLRIASAGLASATVNEVNVELDRLIPANPGRYVVRAWSLDGRLMTKYVSLAAGDEGVPVTFTFPLLPQAAALPRSQSLPAPTQTPAIPRRDPWRTAAWITGGAAVTAAIVGTITGLIAQSRTTAIRADCDGTTCPESLQDDAARARRLANVSTAAFGMAAINAAFSVTFVLLPPWHGRHDATAKRGRK